MELARGQPSEPRGAPGTSVEATSHRPGGTHVSAMIALSTVPTREAVARKARARGRSLKLTPGQTKNCRSSKREAGTVLYPMSVSTAAACPYSSESGRSLSALLATALAGRLSAPRRSIVPRLLLIQPSGFVGRTFSGELRTQGCRAHGEDESSEHRKERDREQDRESAGEKSSGWRALEPVSLVPVERESPVHG